MLQVTAQNAVLRVKVLDENNLNLPGALVKINNNKSSFITDASGVVVINNLAIAEANMQVSYIGYKEFATKIKITNSFNEVTINLVSGVTTLKGVVVLGDRLKGQAKALNQQKNSSNISNIISADQIGRFPDANIGDALKRVPGVAMQNDQGEARDIIIRGLAPQLNSVTLNGDRIPSAEGDNRRVQMDLIPSDMVQIVEVNKTLTPDMEADAIGGSVNLVTRSAPNKLRVSATLSAGHNPIRDGALANMALVVGGRTPNKKFGAVFSANINTNVYGSDNVEAVWATAANGTVFVNQHDIRKYDVTRTRRSFNFTTDWKINKRNTITASTIYNWRDDWENRFRVRTRSITPFDANGVAVTTPSQVIASYRGSIRRETKGGINSNRVKSRRLEEQIVRSSSLKGEHFWGKAKIDWSSSYANASEIRPNERYIDYQSGTMALSMDIGDPEFPNVTPVTRPNMNAFSFRRLSEQNGDTKEADWNSKVNIKFPVALFKDKETLVKVGARYSWKDKQRNNNFYVYTRQGATVAALANLAGIPSASQTNGDYQVGNKYKADSFALPIFLGSLNLNDASQFVGALSPADYLGSNYKASEKITNAYIRIDQEITDKLSAILGVRYEGTNNYYRGNLLRNSATLLGTSDTNTKYNNILPSITFKYTPKQDVVIRLAATTAIARPAYFDLVPYINVNNNDQQITRGNPALKATRSTNLDLMVEKYFKSIGILSAGVFYKNLDNFFYTYYTNNFTAADYASTILPELGGTNPITTPWRFSQARNGNKAQFYGVEVSLQRQLDFLPGIFKGFGVFLNYTYTKSQADGITTADGATTRTGLALPGTAPHTFNGSLSYENKKFIARISANYTAAYLDVVGANSFEDSYYDKQLFVDFNTSYSISPRVRWFAEINNITNQPLRYYQGTKERTMQVEYYRVRYNTGIKVDIF